LEYSLVGGSKYGRFKTSNHTQDYLIALRILGLLSISNISRVKETEGLHMQNLNQFTSETRTATLGGRVITLENLTPVLSPKEKEKRKREIEKQLFDVFIKYTEK